MLIQLNVGGTGSCDPPFHKTFSVNWLYDQSRCIVVIIHLLSNTLAWEEKQTGFL